VHSKNMEKLRTSIRSRIHCTDAEVHSKNMEKLRTSIRSRIHCADAEVHSKIMEKLRTSIRSAISSEYKEASLFLKGKFFAQAEAPQ